MFDFLDKLRAKPVHIRKQIAIATTAVLSLVIVSVWWGSWSVTSTARIPSSVEEKSPVAVVKGAITDLSGKAVTEWNDAKEQLRYAAEHPETLAAVGVNASSTPSTPSVSFEELLSENQ